MSQLKNITHCPHCGQQIDVNNLLHQQIESELHQHHQQQLAQQATEYQQQQQSLSQQLRQQIESEQAAQFNILQQELQAKSQQLQEFNQAKVTITRLQREQEEQKAKITAEFAQRFNKRLQAEQDSLRVQIRQQMQTEQAVQLNTLQQELQAKSQQLQGFNQAKAEIEGLKRQQTELRTQIMWEQEQKFSQQLVAERLKIQQQIEEQAEFKLLELQKKLDDSTNLAAEMQRKAEQGSVQIQGEVQELAIEDWLQANFPLDQIVEIKKGARGADCLQTVHTNIGQVCGSIYYESKRTKEFQASWIEKFKADIREKNAAIGVLVTASMPTDMQRMGQKDGVWICSFAEFKGLSAVLRESVINVAMASASQENKGDKMVMLYDYLTQNEFKLQIEAIVEGFSQMQTDLEAEKRAMARIWKQREKQLHKVLLNTIQMHGAIKGIAGNAVASVALLELGNNLEDS